MQKDLVITYKLSELNISDLEPTVRHSLEFNSIEDVLPDEQNQEGGFDKKYVGSITSDLYQLSHESVMPKSYYQMDTGFNLLDFLRNGDNAAQEPEEIPEDGSMILKDDTGIFHKIHFAEDATDQDKMAIAKSLLLNLSYISKTLNDNYNKLSNQDTDDITSTHTHIFNYHDHNGEVEIIDDHVHKNMIETELN